MFGTFMENRFNASLWKQLFFDSQQAKFYFAFDKYKIKWVKK